MAGTVRIGGIRADLRLGLAELQKDAAKAAGVLGSLEKEFKKFGNSLNTILRLGGVVAGFTALSVAAKELTGVVLKLASAGDQLSDAQEAFKQLGGTISVIESTRKATGDLVSELKLLQIANEGVVQGFPNLNKNFALVAEFATRFAEATGKNATESVEKLVNAIAKGTPKALKEFGILAKKGDDVEKVFAQIREQMDKLPPVQDSVDNASTRVANAFSSLFARIGQIVNEAPALIAALNTIASTMNKLADGIEAVSGTGKLGLASRLGDAKDELEAFTKQFPNLEVGGDDPLSKRFLELTKNVADAEAALRSYLDQEKNAKGAAASGGSTFLGGESDAAKKLKEELEKATEKWNEFTNKIEQGSLEKALAKAIDDFNRADFDSLLTKFGVGLNDEFQAALDEFKSKGGKVSEEQAAQWKEAFVRDGLDPFQKEWADKQEELAKKAADDFRASFDDFFTFFQSTLTELFETGTIDFGRLLQQVAIDFVSTIAAGLAASLTGLQFSGSIGQILGASVLGGIPGIGVSGGAGGGGALSGLAIGAGASGILGSLGGGAGILTGSGAVLSAGADAGEIAAAGGAVGSAALPGTGILGALGPYGAAAAGVAIIAGFAATGGFDSILGSLGLGGGPTNPETLARKDLVGKLEELIKKIGGLKYFDSQGNLQNISDIKLGSNDRFNQPGWAQNLQEQFGATKTNAFFGVGEALKELLGITEDVGSQIGAVLLEQMGGDIEGLKAIIDAAGLSYEDFINMMLERGKEGGATWLEIVSQIRDANAAFQDGIEGVGMYAQAFTNLLNSGGKGQLALNQVVNLAIEGIEAGMSSIQDLQNALIQSGQFSTDEIQALFEALAQNGITSLEQLKGASDLLLAQIVAAVDAALQDKGGGWRQTNEGVQELADNINQLDGKEIDITFNVHSNLDEGAQAVVGVQGADPGFPQVEKFAKGGVIQSPEFFSSGTMLGLAGEAGPEAILPLRSINGRLGVSAQIGQYGGGAPIIHIDARGSEAGVEHSIRRALSDLEGHLMNRTMSAIRESQRRGSWGQ